MLRLTVSDDFGVVGHDGTKPRLLHNYGISPCSQWLAERSESTGV